MNSKLYFDIDQTVTDSDTSLEKVFGEMWTPIDEKYVHVLIGFFLFYASTDYHG